MSDDENLHDNKRARIDTESFLLSQAIENGQHAPSSPNASG
ncbi:hypothetical protein EhV156_00297 [Emiliania huxleyi virus 156]|nr:hypothetical protein EhV156_00297 [Emiliania huxleyi virus 156]